LIKGIFSGSNRGASDGQHHHSISIGHNNNQSYDNTGGLARRPSKRVSNPPPFSSESFLVFLVPLVLLLTSCELEPPVFLSCLFTCLFPSLSPAQHPISLRLPLCSTCYSV
jgi:hypothetical protein